MEIGYRIKPPINRFLLYKGIILLLIQLPGSIRHSGLGALVGEVRQCSCIRDTELEPLGRICKNPCGNCLKSGSQCDCFEYKGRNKKGETNDTSLLNARWEENVACVVYYRNENQTCTKHDEGYPHHNDGKYGFDFLKNYPALRASGFAIGIAGVIGNAIVIVVTTIRFRKAAVRLSAEQRLTKLFFFSLSISDLIVAIYTVIISAVIQAFVQNKPEDHQLHLWIKPCDVIGTLSLIGSEQSVFTMLLIAISRVFGILRPFSRVPDKAFVVALIISWILSVVLAISPILPIFEDTFVTMMWQNDTEFVRNKIFSDDLKILTSRLQNYSEREEHTIQVGSWAKLDDLLEKLLKVNTTHRYGYYNQFKLCMPGLFPKRDQKSSKFTLAIYLINIICFVLMTVGYALIYRHRKHSKSKMEMCTRADQSESQKLKKKILLILMSDFLCWMIICTLGIANIVDDKVNDEKDCDENKSLALHAMLVFLPINSMLNPFIYSAAPEYLYCKLKACYTTLQSRSHFSVCCNRTPNRAWDDKHDVAEMTITSTSEHVTAGIHSRETNSEQRL